MKRKSSLIKKESKKDRRKDAALEEDSLHSSSSSQSDSEDKGMTETERRLADAKAYLAKLRQEQDHEDLSHSDADALEADREIIAGRLRSDAQRDRGKRAFAWISSKIVKPQVVCSVRAHNQTPTCLASTPDGKIVWTGSKGGDLCRWEVVEGGSHQVRRRLTIKPLPRGSKSVQKIGHSDQILALAISDDGRFLVSAGKDRRVCVWNGQTGQSIAVFTHHRGPVLGVAFRPLSPSINGEDGEKQYGDSTGIHASSSGGSISYQFYTVSADRTVKVWAIDEDRPAYVDTLFGHQDVIPAVATLSHLQDSCVTVGSRDGTARLWKIASETQLVFRSTAGGTLNGIAGLDEGHFLTSADDGTVGVWGVQKKKPLTTLTLNDCMLESLAACPFTDLVACGSAEGGQITIAALEGQESEGSVVFKGIHPCGDPLMIEGGGSVNAMSFSRDGRLLFAIIGKDQRLGRWSVADAKTAGNKLVLIRLY